MWCLGLFLGRNLLLLDSMLIFESVLTGQIDTDDVLRWGKFSLDLM